MQIFFTHIPKAAGTTFRNILINNYGHHHCDWYTEAKSKNIASPMLFPFSSAKEMGALCSISGHWLRYTDEMKVAFPDAKFITFIRDPVDRLISLYKHIVRTWDPDLKFEDWIGDGSRPEISDFQTRFIAGSCDVDLAMEILDKQYFFVGKSELFDESMCILNKMMGNNVETHYKSMRVSNQKNISIKNQPQYKSIIDNIYENNKSDLILNDFVKNNLLIKYKNEYGDISSEELSLFKKDNLNFSFNNVKKNIFLLKKNFYYRPLMILKKSGPVKAS